MFCVFRPSGHLFARISSLCSKGQSFQSVNFGIVSPLLVFVCLLGIMCSYNAMNGTFVVCVCVCVLCFLNCSVSEYRVRSFCCFCLLLGIPTCAHFELLTKYAKQQWGFNGYALRSLLLLVSNCCNLPCLLFCRCCCSQFSCLFWLCAVISRATAVRWTVFNTTTNTRSADFCSQCHVSFLSLTTEQHR